VLGREDSSFDFHDWLVRFNTCDAEPVSVAAWMKWGMLLGADLKSRLDSPKAAATLILTTPCDSALNGAIPMQTKVVLRWPIGVCMETSERVGALGMSTDGDGGPAQVPRIGIAGEPPLACISVTIGMRCSYTSSAAFWWAIAALVRAGRAHAQSFSFNRSFFSGERSIIGVGR